MKPTFPRPIAGALVATILLAASVRASEQDSIAAARDLYSSAAYEDALALLAKLDASGRRADDARTIEQIRAFCLIALDRPVEAEKAIEAVVVADPSYRPSDSDVSPRVRIVFTDVRRRVLPAVVQQKYATAKGEFDRKEFDAASADFAAVLTVLGDPDLATAANQPPLSDVRTLATGFHDLSVKAAAPPPPPAPVPVVAPPPPPAATPFNAPAVPRIYGGDDRNVVPPMIVKQVLPPFPAATAPVGQGTMEVIIDEHGAVVSAKMRTSVNAIYDKVALEAAKTWKYKPAILDGAPVKFRKEIVISLRPRG